MANFKKIDERDIVFVNKSLTPKEEREFSEFLKNRKSSLKVKLSNRMKNKTSKQLA